MLRRSFFCRNQIPLFASAENLTVITRHPSPAMNNCELVLRDRAPINVAKVEAEHENYLNLFNRDVIVMMSDSEDNRSHSSSSGSITARLTSRVISLPPLPAFPDSVFVEDAAIMLDRANAAVLTRPGVASRRGEVEHIRSAVLQLNRAAIFSLEDPATCDGGDVLVVGKFIFVGNSSRTNQAGYEALQRVASLSGYEAVHVPVGKTSCMHLKCAVTKLDEETVLINPNWISRAVFSSRGLRVVEIVSPDVEDEAANVLAFSHRCYPATAANKPEEMNAATLLQVNTIVVSARFPRNVEFMKEWASDANKSSNNGDKSMPQVFFDVHALDVAEIAKAEGALTCCSLIAPMSKRA